MTRTDLSFGPPGERRAAWLFSPATEAPWPCVVLGHGFGGVRRARLDAYAERFADAGVAALVFDYRHFGDSDGEPRQLLDVGRQLDDWRDAIAFARTVDGVDALSIAAWGTSFSGGHVMTIAAEGHGLAAAISQGPFADGVWTLRAAGPANIARLTVAGLRDVLAPGGHAIPIVGPPGTTAAMNSPDAEPGYRALFDDQAAFRNEVLARIALRVGLYRPIRHAERIAMPWLVCVCDHDVVTPPRPALEAASRAPRAEVRRYACGHFDIYRGAWFERVAGDQIAFLQRHLLAGRAEVPAVAAGPA